MDLTQMTDADLEALIASVEAERSRRRDLLTIPVQMDGMNRRYLSLSGAVQGEAWVAPTGAHDAYPEGWLVKHANKTWRSLVAANVWEPGVSGWEIADKGEIPIWMPPTGAHDAYALGAMVRHNDSIWQSVVEANVWEPGIYGWGAPEVPDQPQ
jgi:hypothetical protein